MQGLLAVRFASIEGNSHFDMMTRRCQVTWHHE